MTKNAQKPKLGWTIARVITLNSRCWLMITPTDDPSPQLQGEENEDEVNEVEVQNAVSEEHENEGNKSAKTAEASAKPVVLKHEKPKLPTFYGDVRKYFIFREDFN